MGRTVVVPKEIGLSEREEKALIRTDFHYRYPLVPLDKEKVIRLILHHAAAEKADPEAIHRWHLEKGFGGFGYNEYIRKDGSVVIGRGAFIGAHCKDQNAVSYGICAEGDYEKEERMPPAQREGLVRRIENALSLYPKIKSIQRHSDFRKTSCPGKNFPFDEILRLLEERKKAAGESEKDFERERLTAIRRLAEKGLLRDPAYWERTAKRGSKVRGEYVALLLCRTAKLFE